MGAALLYSVGMGIKISSSYYVDFIQEPFIFLKLKKADFIFLEAMLSGIHIEWR